MTIWHIVGALPLGSEPVDIVISDGIISAILPAGSTPAANSMLIEARGLIHGFVTNLKWKAAAAVMAEAARRLKAWKK